MTKNLHAHSIVARLALLTAVPLIALGASPARDDQRCDDIANQLKTHIDGLKVGITAANTIYLSNPLAIELSLGCSGRNFKNELYAKADSRNQLFSISSAARPLLFSPCRKTIS